MFSVVINILTKHKLVNYLNMTHALCCYQPSLDGRLESREEVSAPRRQRYRRVQEVLVGVGMRQVGELGTEGRHFQIDVVISIE